MSRHPRCTYNGPHGPHDFVTPVEPIDIAYLMDAPISHAPLIEQLWCNGEPETFQHGKIHRLEIGGVDLTPYVAEPVRTADDEGVCTCHVGYANDEETYLVARSPNCPVSHD